jgi:porphobilinogen synthase
MFLSSRPRRNRSLRKLRDGIKETHLSASSLIQPIFVADKTEDISSLPGMKKYSLKDLEVFCSERLKRSNIAGVILFASIADEKKNVKASEALNPDGLLPKAISLVKKMLPDMVVFSDVALDPFSSDGHDGLVKGEEILNDETLEVLSAMSVVHAQAGVDFVAPSDMMDGRVRAIRKALDESGFKNTGVLSYTAKYASSFYGPFRGALDSKPRFGDKKTYQMDFRNKKEALRELKEDESEGADMVMVKPALSYLDIIQDFKNNTHLPVVAYNVSAEYSMVKAAAEKGWIDEQAVQEEVLTSIKRAGADLIITYSALDMDELLGKN